MSYARRGQPSYALEEMMMLCDGRNMYGSVIVCLIPPPAAKALGPEIVVDWPLSKQAKELYV